MFAPVRVLDYVTNVMPADTQSIFDAAMSLSDAERAELATMLDSSIGDGSEQAEMDAAWIAEAKRRLHAVQTGNAPLISSEDVERELDAIVADATTRRSAG